MVSGDLVQFRFGSENEGAEKKKFLINNGLIIVTHMECGAMYQNGTLIH